MHRQISSGAFAAVALLGLYFGVLTAISGWAFTLSEFQKSWGYILALSAGFGIQVGLFMRIREIHAHHSAARRTVAVSGSASTAAMLACCSHYVANLIPLVGVAGAVTLIAEYQTQLFWLGLAFNLVGIVYVSRQVYLAGQHVHGEPA